MTEQRKSKSERETDQAMKNLVVFLPRTAPVLALVGVVLLVVAHGYWLGWLLLVLAVGQVGLWLYARRHTARLEREQA